MYQKMFDDMNKKKEKLLSEIKLKERKKKFNNDNINLLYKTIDQYNEDEHFNRNILKAKNLIIKNMYDRANGNVKIPHYSLPKNIRINSAQKSKRRKARRTSGRRRAGEKRRRRREKRRRRR